VVTILALVLRYSKLCREVTTGHATEHTGSAAKFKQLAQDFHASHNFLLRVRRPLARETHANTHRRIVYRFHIRTEDSDDPSRARLTCVCSRVALFLSTPRVGVQVLTSQLRVTHHQHLAQLVTRLNFNEFYFTASDECAFQVHPAPSVSPSRPSMM
jgi:hypothetical protein